MPFQKGNQLDYKGRAKGSKNQLKQLIMLDIGEISDLGYSIKCIKIKG